MGERHGAQLYGNSTDMPRERAARFFTYLQKLAKLRTKVIRTWRTYEVTVWFDDVPKAPQCFVAFWDPEEAHTRGIWLEVRRPDIKAPPPVPEPLRRYVAEVDLEDVRQIPELPELEAEPELQALWDEYREGPWLEWAVENEQPLAVRKVYAPLFGIYQHQRRSAEDYELVIGLGLLTWKAPSEHDVQRHLITVRAEIELDEKTGAISVRPAAEAASPTFESDMLEPDQQPSQTARNEVEKQVSEIGSDITDLAAVEAPLRKWAHEVSAAGAYRRVFSRSEGATVVQQVTLSPAVILRKRTKRGIERRALEILNQLRAGGDLPPCTRRLVGDNSVSSSQATASEQAEAYREPEEPLFPLETNEQQARIVHVLEEHDGVLVQGPPGTGKSHTIVNLVCHLVGTGRRVLVTSQTPRALQVLKQMMVDRDSTKEMASLCVSLLGNGRAALKDLEDSVAGINAQYQSWDEGRSARQTKRLRENLDQLRRQESKLLGDLRGVRGAETEEHHLCEGAYSGTAQEIAKAVAAGASEHGWLSTEVTEAQPPLKNAEALELFALRRDLDGARVAAAGRASVPTDELVTPEAFLKHWEREQVAANARKEYVDLLRTPLYSSLSVAPESQRTALRMALIQLQADRAAALNQRAEWVAGAVSDVCSYTHEAWEALLENALPHHEALEGQSRLAEETVVEVPDPYDRTQVKADASDLAEHLEHGGRLGFWPFRPKVVRRALYLTRQVRVAGRLCDNAAALKALVAVIEVDEHLDALWAYWEQRGVRRLEADRPTQVAHLSGQLTALKAVLGLRDTIQKAEAIYSGMSGVPVPQWGDPQDVALHLRALDAVEAEVDLVRSRANLRRTEEKLRAATLSPGCHPAVREALDSVTHRDVDAYANAYGQLRELEEDRRRIRRRDELDERLTASAPEVAKRLAAEPHAEFWEDALAAFEESWAWARARTWLRAYLDGPSESEISRKLERVRQQIGRTKGRLAAEMAWAHCFRRMTQHPEQRSHLMAWHQAVEKIGAGTGKYAEKHRRDAQYHMERCRGAIPAWIMPLYRVDETVKPAPGFYDVAVIDEASQSSVEAACLLYIAKKVVVVGDENQISPEARGIPLAPMHALQDNLVHDLPAPDALGLDTSFFALGEILFGGRITLREHFRCVPEIIRFSNDLWYSKTPLEPLRQYPPERLDPPVVTRHVPDGYLTQRGRSKINRPEAEALVETLVECCEDPRYEDNTMGVISLLGTDQARLIERMLLEKLGPKEMEERRITCGNAYAFQGDERDVMFLSMVAVPGETGLKALTGRGNERRFNVAASRARDQMWLFHTPMVNDIQNPACLRRKLLEFCLGRGPQGAGDLPGDVQDRFDSQFERDVYDRIAERGYRVIPQYEIAGYFIDLMIEGNRARLAVECDGDKWHSAERYEADMRRQRQLERCGLHFWRLRGSEFYADPEAALGPLWELLERRGIQPVYSDSDTGKKPGASDPQDGPQNASEVEEVVIDQVQDGMQSPGGQRVRQYRAWKPRELPDPRSTSVAEVAQGLREIVAVEGPVRWLRAYHAYAHAAGIKRVGRRLREEFNRAAQKAVRLGLVEDRDEGLGTGYEDRVARERGGPTVVLRTRGDRKIDQLPPAEIAAAMKLVLSSRSVNPGNQEMIYRKAADVIGIGRFTDKARRIFFDVWNRYVDAILGGEEL